MAGGGSSQSAEARGYALADGALLPLSEEPTLAPFNENRYRFVPRVVGIVGLLVGAVSVMAFVQKRVPEQAIPTSVEAPDDVLPSVELSGVLPFQTWEPRFLDDYPQAKCNDGSPAAYYYRAGDPTKQKWLVWLEGAGWCWDVKSCSRPWHQGLGTSKSFPRSPRRVHAWTRSMQGIFDPVKDPLKGIHVAYVRTCGNDAFLGDSSPQPGTNIPGLSWYFRGKAIIEAVFADLRKRDNLGTNPEHRVLYGGCSSGARGALMSLDYVATNLVGNATTMGLLDSGVWLPLEPHLPELVSFDAQTQSFLQFANASGLISTSCKSAYGEEEQWKCLRGASRLPFVKTPYFITQSQYDLFAISVNFFGRYAPFVGVGPAQKIYAEKYRRQLVHYLPVPELNSGQTIYSTACYTHCTLTSHTFFKIKADGIVLAVLFHRWLNAKTPYQATGYLVDRCDGFNCCPHGEDADKVVTTTTTEAPKLNTTGKTSKQWLSKMPGWSWLVGRP